MSESDSIDIDRQPIGYSLALYLETYGAGMSDAERFIVRASFLAGAQMFLMAHREGRGAAAAAELDRDLEMRSLGQQVLE